VNVVSLPIARRFLTFWLEKIKNRELHNIDDLAIKAGKVEANGVTCPGSIKELHIAATAYGVHETQNKA